MLVQETLYWKWMKNWKTVSLPAWKAEIKENLARRETAELQELIDYHANSEGNCPYLWAVLVRSGLPEKGEFFYIGW
jgi:hypothetical protein